MTNLAKVLFLLHLSCSLSIHAQEQNNNVNQDPTSFYLSALEESSFGDIKLIDQKAFIPDSVMLSNTLFLVNPEFPNIPFGGVEVKNNGSSIDISKLIKGQYFVHGMNNGRKVTYKLVNQ